MIFWIVRLLKVAVRLSLIPFAFITFLYRIMSFFNSLRRRSTPDRQLQDEQTARAPNSIRRRALTAWSTTPKRRQAIAWNDAVFKSEDVGEDKTSAVEGDLYSKYDPRDPKHITPYPGLADGIDNEQQTPELRGRALSRSRSTPFSAFRRRSRSASLSSAKNFLHKAAELVKAPTALFYKARASEDSNIPLVTPSSPSKSLRSRKSVHFSANEDDEEEENAPRLSTAMHSRIAPSLPPFEISTLTLMNLGEPSLAVLSSKHPAEQLMKALDTGSAMDGQITPTMRLQVSDEITPPEFKPNSLQEARGKFVAMTEPSSYDTRTLAVSHSNLTGQTHLRDSPSTIEVEPSQEQSVTLSNGCDAMSTRYLGSELSILANASSESRPSTNSLPVSGIALGEDPRRDFPTHEKSVTDIRMASNVSLPLRLKRSGDIAEARLESGSSLDDKILSSSTQPKAVNHTNESTGRKSETETAEIESIRDSLRQSITSTDAGMKAEQAHAVLNCADMLRRMSIEDTSSNPLVSSTIEHPPTNLQPKVQGSTPPPPYRSDSQSPSRRRFRFENRAETSVSQHPTVSDIAPTKTVTKSRAGATPPPCSIPLPPSAHPSRQTYAPNQAHTFRDQYGWSPFADEEFAAIASRLMVRESGKKDFAKIVCQRGGFALFWQNAGLSPNTAPQKNTTAPTREEVETLICAIVDWAPHPGPEHSGKSVASPKYNGVFPVKYFKRRDHSPRKDGFFAPITSFDRHASSGAFSNETRNVFVETDESSRSQTSQSASDRSVSVDCSQPACLCSPCDCNPCQCGQPPTPITKNKQTSLADPTETCTCDVCKCDPCRCGQSQEHLAQRNIDQRAVPTGACTCNPCQCNPCQCGVQELEDMPRQCHLFGSSAVFNPVDDKSKTLHVLDNRNPSASSEPSQMNEGRLPPIGSVPLRYYSRAWTDSRTTLASDTSLDEDEAEAYCAGIV